MRNQNTSGNPNISREVLQRAGMPLEAIDAMQRGVETSRGWQVIPITSGQWVTTGTGDPAYSEINSSGRFGWTFTNEALEADEKRLVADVIIPHGVRRGSDLVIYINCIQGSVNPYQDAVLWQVTHSSINKDGDVLSSSIVTTTNSLMPMLDGSVDYRFTSHTLLTRRDEKIREGSILSLQVRRRTSTTDDNYAGSVYLLNGGVLYYAEKAGTYDKFPK